MTFKSPFSFFFFLICSFAYFSLSNLEEWCIIPSTRSYHTSKFDCLKIFWGEITMQRLGDKSQVCEPWCLYNLGATVGKNSLEKISLYEGFTQEIQQIKPSLSGLNKNKYYFTSFSCGSGFGEQI